MKPFYSATALGLCIKHPLDQPTAIETPIGFLPNESDINVDNLEKIDLSSCLEIDGVFWKEEMLALKLYFENQLSDDIPNEIKNHLNSILDSF